MIRNILVTGATGYLGGRIVLSLAQDARLNLKIVTRRPTSDLPAWTRAYSVETVDISRPEHSRAACEGIDTVIHLAALDEGACRTDPQKAIRVNVAGTLTLLQAAEACGVERFIFFSTAHVYGSPLRGHITEFTPTRPVQPYAITHRAAEDFVLAAHSENRLAGVVLRVSNGFGYPASPEIDRWNLLVNNLCRQAVTTRRLALRTNGLQRRNFIPISDITRAVSHCLAVRSEKLGDGLFNLGGRCSYTILEMAQFVAQRCASIMGFYPEIITAHGEDNPGGSLEYSSEKLYATGFSPVEDIYGEIDCTLRVCEEAFAGIER